jgi:hypothetical protein
MRTFILNLVLFLARFSGFAQIASPDGTFNAETTSNLTLQTSLVPRLSILNSNGFIGIGKANPAYLLDVNGIVNTTALLVHGIPVVSSKCISNSSNIHFSTRRVGIGISTSTEALHVNASILSGNFSSTTEYFDAGASSNVAFFTNTIDRFISLTS